MIDRYNECRGRARRPAGRSIHATWTTPPPSPRRQGPVRTPAGPAPPCAETSTPGVSAASTPPDSGRTASFIVQSITAVGNDTWEGSSQARPVRAVSTRRQSFRDLVESGPAAGSGSPSRRAVDVGLDVDPGVTRTRNGAGVDKVVASTRNAVADIGNGATPGVGVRAAVGDRHGNPAVSARAASTGSSPTSPSSTSPPPASCCARPPPALASTRSSPPPAHRWPWSTTSPP